MKMTKKVNPSDYYVHEYIGGYYGICDNPYGANPVLGGDPANPDDYNEDFFINVLSAWDGTLVDCGSAIYGEDGYCIEL